MEMGAETKMCLWVRVRVWNEQDIFLVLGLVIDT